MDRAGQTQHRFERPLQQPVSDEQTRQRHVGGDQTAGENHLDTARANCFHETEPGAGSDTGLKQNQADLPEGEVGAKRDDPGEGARVFAVPQDQTHDQRPAGKA